MDRTQFRRTALAFAAASVLALGWFAGPSRAAEEPSSFRRRPAT